MPRMLELPHTTFSIALCAVIAGCANGAPPPADRAEPAAPTRSAPPRAVPSAPPPAPVPPDAGTRRRYQVTALGDSLTDPRSGGGKFLDYLRKRCPNSRFDSLGKGGDMVNQMRRRFAAAQGGAGYSHVIVFGGVNDLYSDKTAGRTPKKVAADLTAIYAAARGNGARVIAITVAPWGGFHRYYNPERAEATRTVNRWILEQLASGAIDYAIESGPLLSCGDPERLCPSRQAPHKDGLHFGPEGHTALGEALFRQVFGDCE
jgi:lysophospholipase L1-like esterase